MPQTMISKILLFRGNSDIPSIHSPANTSHGLDVDYLLTYPFPRMYKWFVTRTPSRTTIL